MMKKVFSATILFSVMLLVRAGAAPMDSTTVSSTPPATPAELEAVYNNAIENRTVDILKALALDDEAKSNRVHDIIVAQYRALRARDEIIDARLRLIGKPVTFVNRAPDLAAASKSLHEQFLKRLAVDLTPAQIEMVKDKMTYNKLEKTYTAYCSIVPDLTDSDKARIMELLKEAREDAMDGGSAPEKSAIFQRYKDQINDYLTRQGHDLVKAYRDWNAKHPDQADTNALQNLEEASK